MSRRQAIIFAAIHLPVAIAFGYGLARLGEPRAHWFWCQMLGAC
jgi:hypothetical protein